MGLFNFLFSSGVSNSQKKAHRNAVNNTSSDHDCSYNNYHDSGYCDRDEYEGIENDECYDDNCGW